eukprot:1987651-Prymnesium_polylepis.1
MLPGAPNVQTRKCNSAGSRRGVLRPSGPSVPARSKRLCNPGRVAGIVASVRSPPRPCVRLPSTAAKWLRTGCALMLIKPVACS